MFSKLLVSHPSTPTLVGLNNMLTILLCLLSLVLGFFIGDVVSTERHKKRVDPCWEWWVDKTPQGPNNAPGYWKCKLWDGRKALFSTSVCNTAADRAVREGM